MTTPPQTEAELFRAVTHVRCVMCEEIQSFDAQRLGIMDADAFEDVVYETIECCGDPFYNAMIITREPLFGAAENDINADYLSPAGPETPFREAQEHDEYQYELNDDFLQVEWPTWKEEVL